MMVVIGIFVFICYIVLVRLVCCEVVGYDVIMWLGFKGDFKFVFFGFLVGGGCLVFVISVGFKCIVVRVKIIGFEVFVVLVECLMGVLVMSLFFFFCV